MTKREFRKKWKIIRRIAMYILLILTIAVIVIAGIVAFSQPSVKNALSNATTRKPEPFTELYFENHTQLPTKFQKGKQISFSFTIHNLTGKDRQYPYEVYFDVAGEKLYLDKKTVFIKNNESKTIQESFTPTVLSPDAEAVINLTDLKQQIDFWLKGNITLP